MTTTMMQDAAMLADIAAKLPALKRQAKESAANSTRFLEDRHNCAILRAELSDVTAPMGWPENTAAFKSFAKRHKLAGVEAVRGWFSDYYLTFDGICQACGREAFHDEHFPGPVSMCCGSWLLRVDGGRVDDLEARPF